MGQKKLIYEKLKFEIYYYRYKLDSQENTHTLVSQSKVNFIFGKKI